MREWENGRMGEWEEENRHHNPSKHNTTQHSNTNSKHEAYKTRLTDIKLFIPGLVPRGQSSWRPFGKSWASRQPG